MPIQKKNNQINITQTKQVTIVVCLIILILIPVIIWLLGFKDTTSNLSSYKGESYTFYFPKNWTISKNAMQNIKGTEFFLQPPNATPPKTPHITIEVANANSESVNAMTDAFTIFKYTKSNSIVDGVHAQKYTTIVPSSEGVLHSTAYVFEENGNIYLIEVGYKQQTADSQLENEFTQIVTTFIAH